MAAEDPADRLALLLDFGRAVFFAPHGGTLQEWVPAIGVFYDEHVSLDFGGDAAVSASRPRVLVREEDIAGVESEGWGLFTLLPSRGFDVVDIRRDGTGLAEVLLTKRR
ncbi:MAG: head-tail joining protein [Planctomycetota bacterium]